VGDGGNGAPMKPDPNCPKCGRNEWELVKDETRVGVGQVWDKHEIKVWKCPCGHYERDAE
jgi:hypothetical protein